MKTAALVILGLVLLIGIYILDSWLTPGDVEYTVTSSEDRQ